jgi:hypothetical protein
MGSQIYGEASTINSANYVYFIALEKVIDLGHPTAGSFILKPTVTIHQASSQFVNLVTTHQTLSQFVKLCHNSSNFALTHQTLSQFIKLCFNSSNFVTIHKT